jgi:hypothetical protein
MRAARRMVLFVALAAAIGPARGHSASRGLHVHPVPDPVSPGVLLACTIDAREPLNELRIGIVGEAPVRWRSSTPSRHLVLTVRVPEEPDGAALNVQAEGRTESGAAVRASSIVRIRRAGTGK